MKKRWHIFPVALLLLFIFVGCATTSKSTYGKDFNETAKDSIVKGVTAKKDLLKMLGEPQDKGIDDQNREWWVYLYQEGKYVFNAFDGIRGRSENELRTKKLLITFDNDIVKNFVYSDSTTPSTTKW